MRQRCQLAPGSVAPIASTRPRWASLVTSATPDRPRATRSRKNASQPAPSSAEVTCRPRISLWPSALTAVASRAWTLIDAPALAHLQHQRIGGHERVGPGVQRPGAERFDLLVEILRHHRDLRLRQPGDAEGLDQLLHPRVLDAEQIAGGHHRHQGGLGAAPPLEQPIGKVADPERS